MDNMIEVIRETMDARNADLISGQTQGQITATALKMLRDAIAAVESGTAQIQSCSLVMRSNVNASLVVRGANPYSEGCASGFYLMFK